MTKINKIQINDKVRVSCEMMLTLKLYVNSCSPDGATLQQFCLLVYFTLIFT